MVGSLLRLYKKIGTDAKVWHLYRLIKYIETFSAASTLSELFFSGSTEELVVEDDEEQRDCKADARGAGSLHVDGLSLGKLGMAAHIRQDQGDQQQDVHRTVHVVEISPADEADEDGQADEDQDWVILADLRLFFLVVGFILLVELFLQFLILICHGDSLPFRFTYILCILYRFVNFFAKRIAGGEDDC